MFGTFPRPLERLLGILPLALCASLACARQEPPPYTRVDGAAPELLEREAGATLVVFWATWCPPCREELPSLRALASDPPAQVRLVTFGEDAESGSVRDFFAGEPPPELGYRLDHEQRASAAFGVDSLPAAFLVVDGRLVARFSGFRDWNSRAMRRLLTKLASERPDAGPAGKPTGR